MLAEPDHDIPETEAILRDSKVLSNDFEADKVAMVMAASPRLAELLLRLTHPSIPHDRATVIEAHPLLGKLGFNLDRAYPHSLSMPRRSQLFRCQHRDRPRLSGR